MRTSLNILKGLFQGYNRLAACCFILFLAGCTKEQCVPASASEEQNVPKAGQYALFQITNYIGDPTAPRKFDVQKDYSMCLYGRIQMPVSSSAPVFGFLQNSAGTLIWVHGYCDLHPTECVFEKGSSPSTLGPVYSITPIQPGVSVPTLNVQFKGIYVPMGVNGSFFSYDAAAKTWSASGDASQYFAYSLNNHRFTACP